MIRAGRSLKLTVRVLMAGKPTLIAKDGHGFVIPAEAAIYCRDGCSLCPEALMGKDQDHMAARSLPCLRQPIVRLDQTVILRSFGTPRWFAVKLDGGDR
jgi:hypothetical protein